MGEAAYSADLIQRIDATIAQANAQPARRVLRETGAPPTELGRRLCALQQELAHRPAALARLYAALHPDMSRWLANVSVSDEFKELVRDILARNREAFRTLADL